MAVVMGSSSRRTSNRFGAISTFNVVTPVTVPPGRCKLATSPSLDRVGTHHENDRNCRGRCLSGGRGQTGTARREHAHPTGDQLGHLRSEVNTMGRSLRCAVMILLALAQSRATAQDIPGLEACTAEKQMERRTGCLQSNDEFLQQVLSKLARETQAKIVASGRALAAAEAEIAALKSANGEVEQRAGTNEGEGRIHHQEVEIKQSCATRGSMAALGR